MDLMRVVTHEEPVVWAGEIIGFGEYSYQYESGHSGIALLAAFAPTARHQTIYLEPKFQETQADLVAQLMLDPNAKNGLPKMSKACLYLTNLDAINLDILRKLITVGVSR